MKITRFSLFLSFISSIIILSCSSKTPEITESKQDQKKAMSRSKQIKVLNFGTFHMGFTNDAHKTEFDENDRENQQRVHNIAERLADFKPTVILVEREPKHNEEIQREYKDYVANPDTVFKNPSEIELLAYELGRLSGTQRIYGIDHKMRYNYRIGFQINNHVNPDFHDKYYEDPFSFYPSIDVNEDSLSLSEKLKLMNKDRYLDFLIAVNANMLTHVGTENGFEGADEAAKYYKRNLRMYSNLNRLELHEDDRVFILMGASHTAFFRDFMRGDPKYKMVDTHKYLK